MMAVRGSGPHFLAAIITLIISTLQTVSSINDNNAGRYRKILTNNESDLAFRWDVEVVPRRSEMLAAIVDQILERYLAGEKLLHVVAGNQMEFDDFEDILKMGSTSVITMVPDGRNFDMPRIVYQKPTCYLLLGINLSDVIEPLVNFSMLGSSWNPRGLYITIAQNEKEAVSLMMSLREKFVYKVVVLVPHNDPLDRMIEAYTWRPYHPQGNCESPTRESLVRLGTLTETLNFMNETDIWPGIIPKNFGNCPLNIYYIVWEPYVLSPEEEKATQGVSLEVVLIELVCGKIGARVNRTFSSNKLEMKFEAAAGAIMAQREHFDMYDVSMPYIQDSLGWFAPRKYKRSTIFTSNEEFSLMFVISTVTAMCLASILLKVAGYRHWVISIWGSLWEQSNWKVPNKIRGVWCCWLLVCLNLSTVYKTALVNYFSHPFDEIILSESDLLKSGLRLSFIDAAQSYFDENEDLGRKILEQYDSCRTVPECYREIPTGRAVFTNEMLVKYLNGRKDVPNSLIETVHQLPSSLTYKLSMLYTKGHPMFPAFDESMLWTIQAGFVEYWLRKIEVLQESISVRKSIRTRDNYLSLGEVRGAFYALMFGLSVGGISFLCEIFYHPSKRIKR